MPLLPFIRRLISMLNARGARDNGPAGPFCVEIWDDAVRRGDDVAYRLADRFPTSEAAIVRAKAIVLRSVESFGFDEDTFRQYGEYASVVDEVSGRGVGFDPVRYAHRVCRGAR